MTERVPIGDILWGDRTGQPVKVRGWVYRSRSSGGIAFLLLRDATGILQSTFRKERVGDDLFAAVEGAGRESSVVVEGIVAEDKRAPGGYEVRGTAFEVIGPSPNFPIARDLSDEFLLDVRHLWIRSRRMTSIFKVRATVFRAIHDYFRNEGFYEVHPPIITAVGSEGGASLFNVRYFDRDLHLAQSWQLYAEALVLALERIYTVAPSFRAEKSRTPRHLTEFWHAEMEVAWEGMEEALRHGEAVITWVAQEVATRHEAELAYLERDGGVLRSVKPPFPRITYDEALERLQAQGVEVEWGKDLRTLEERALGEMFDLPVIVTRYPKETQAFYKRTDPEDPDLVLAFDFIAPGRGGELIGGSEREPDLETLKDNLVRTGEDPKAYDWYLDTRRYGSVPHSGFGMGVDRLVQWVLDLEHIRDAIPFPRTPTRYAP